MYIVLAVCISCSIIVDFSQAKTLDFCVTDTALYLRYIDSGALSGWRVWRVFSTGFAWEQSSFFLKIIFTLIEICLALLLTLADMCNFLFFR